VEEIEPLLSEKTKVIYGEVIGNPGLDIVDIRGVAALAHDHGIPLIVDSTTATPYLLRPFDFGADIVVHSSSKYINGGGNAVSGVIVDSGKFPWDFEKYPGMAPYKKYGGFAYIAKLRNGIWRNMGGCLAPMNAYLNVLGLDTLGLRMEKICDNALRLAQWLEKTEGVDVNYPALEGNPYQDLVKSQLKGQGGGILTVRAGSRERAYKLMNNLKYALNATNIGDARTLVIHPASTIYIHNTPEQQEAAGVYEDTIRVSVGIEDVADLIEDFNQAIHQLS
jgi:O-acetylhomoserine (thiol)-lyase